jgi:hypothetical protein
MVLMLTGAVAAAASELPDPMRPAEFKSTPEQETDQDSTRPSLSLQSTLIAPGRRSAVINGRSVRVGGTIEGVEVVAIRATRVRLRDGQGVFTVRLPSAGRRKRVESGE